MSKKKNYQTDNPCCICGIQSDGMVTFHHIKTRGSGGEDVYWNMMPLCQCHHNEIHQKGTSHMAIKYNSIMKWLICNDWIFSNQSKKWVRV